MARIEINPYDNDRLKTRKVQANLAELGVLPEDHDQRPTFLRDHRAAAILIDRALARLTPPQVQSHCRNKAVLAASANLSFTAAYTAFASGNFTQTGAFDAVNGAYALGGVPCALADIIDLSDPDAAFDPDLDIDAGGVKPRNVGGGNYSGRSLSIKDPLLADILANGCTAVFEMVGDDVQTSRIGLYGGDPPTYALMSEAAFYSSDPDASHGEFVFSSADGNTFFTDTINGAGGGIHKVALTIRLDGTVAGSIDGGAVHAHSVAFFDPTMVRLYFATGSPPATRLRSFAFYAPVADAELPTLSA